MKKRTASNCKTRQEVANEYGFSYQTLKRKLKSHNITLPRGLLCPNTLIQIYEALGYPLSISKSHFEMLLKFKGLENNKLRN